MIGTFIQESNFITELCVSKLMRIRPSMTVALTVMPSNGLNVVGMPSYVDLNTIDQAPPTMCIFNWSNQNPLIIHAALKPIVFLEA